MTVWFTGDHYFGHANIIKLCKRPFSSVDEMDQVMSDRWNEVVRPYDTVYHLGNFSMGVPTERLKSLNGHKVLIKGNHDHSNIVNKTKGWQSVHDLLTVKITHVDIVLDVILCHYALRVWNKKHYGSLHLYGHSHGTLPGDSQSQDVGVDCWNFYPVTIDRVIDRMNGVKD